MKTTKKARKISSSIIGEILGELTLAEKTQTAVKMKLAAELDDLIRQRGLSKGDFADRVGKHPSSKKNESTASFDHSVGIQKSFHFSQCVGITAKPLFGGQVNRGFVDPVSQISDWHVFQTLVFVFPVIQIE